MKKYIIPSTLVSSVILLSSCGKNEESSPESSTAGSSDQVENTVQSDLIARAKEVIKPSILEQTGNYLLETPSYLEMEGPIYDLKEQGDSGMVMVRVLWQWKSAEELYELSKPLQTADGEVLAISKSQDAGVIGEYSAVGTVADINGVAKIHRLQSKMVGEFEPSKEGFSRYGQPRKNFPKSVILGTDEYFAAIKSAKALKDAEEEKLRIAKQEAEAKKRAEANAKRDELLTVLNKEGSLKGVSKRPSKGTTAQITLDVVGISETAGETFVKISIFETTNRGKKLDACILEGSFDSDGNLKLLPIKRGRYEGYNSSSASAYLNNDSEVNLEWDGDVDRLQLKAKIRGGEFIAKLIRK